MAHTYDSVLQHIVGYLHGRLEGAPEVHEHSRFVADLNVDSMEAFEIVGDLEDVYQIVVPLALLQQGRIQTVEDLTREIVRLLGERR
jgi:acyl carrier protein